MRNPHLRNLLQNTALVLLTASALFLLTRLPLLQNIRLSAPTLFTVEPGGETEDIPPAAMFASVNLMATRDSDEYGRCGRLCAGADDEALQEVLPLFQEALGSAVPAGAVEDTALREALNHPGLYLELTGGPLPLEAVAAWLEADAPFQSSVRSMALTAEGDEGTSLFLLDGEGNITRCNTALPVSALRSSCEKISPNGSYFAYETGYTSLAPYTVLMPKITPPPDVTAERPAGYSAYNLLTALDFNAHTLSRYTESGGAEVVEESPRTLRIGPDGVVSFTNRGGGSGLYRASGEGLREALVTAARLAAALTEGTGASPLFLQEAEATENGWVLRFRYQADGVPVYFSDGGYALAITFQSGTVASFTYRCRAYTPLEEEPAALLPTDMAQAIAAAFPDAALSIGYEDDGSGQLAAQWRR